MIENVLSGASLLGDWLVVICTLSGIVIGIIIGAIPGLGPTVAIAALIPLTFVLSPIPSMMLLLGVYQGGIFGGSISAILFNIPGTPAASATVLDGFPLAKKGQGGKALKMALYASIYGNVFSCLVLLFVAEPLAAVALRFGPTEMSGLIFLALTIISAVGGRSVLRGLLMGFLGMLFSTVGLDPVWGTARMTFGNPNLDNGFSLIPVLVGLFAISEVMIQAGRPDFAASLAKSGGKATADTESGHRLSLREIWEQRGIMTWSAIIGVFFGFLPGIGSTTPAFISYGLAKQRSKTPEAFGKGALAGVAAPETANNAVTGGALIPLLSLGVPGDAVTAVILGALMLQGLAPGPFLFRDNGPQVYAILIGLLLASIPTLILGLLLFRYAVRILSVKNAMIFPVVLVMCVFGAYSVNNSMFDVATMCLFGIIGYGLRRYNYPIPPLLIGFILGGPFEWAVRQSLLISQGSPLIFFEHPISAAFVSIGLLVAVFSFRLSRRLRF